MSIYICINLSIYFKRRLSPCRKQKNLPPFLKADRMTDFYFNGSSLPEDMQMYDRSYH